MKKLQNLLFAMLLMLSLSTHVQAKRKKNNLVFTSPTLVSGVDNLIRVQQNTIDLSKQHTAKVRVNSRNLQDETGALSTFKINAYILDAEDNKLDISSVNSQVNRKNK